MPANIITIKQIDKLHHVMQPCADVEISELKSETLNQIKKDMLDALTTKLPEIATGKHATPAYLAANQIGVDKRIVLLYLPDNKGHAKNVFLYNPTFEEMNHFSGEENQEFRISTFLATQLRFQKSCYAQKIKITHLHEEFFTRQELILENNSAIAATMAINFTQGITPLDYHISESQLNAFATNGTRDDYTGPIVTTERAYQLRNQEVDKSKEEFGTDQLQAIPAFLKLRGTYPLQKAHTENIHLHTNNNTRVCM